MITTNPILEEKRRVQMQVDEEAQHDAGKYMEICNRIAHEIEEEYGIQLRYGTTEDESVVLLQNGAKSA